jgi:uncharacterized protein YeaO (DUF488 family)
MAILLKNAEEAALPEDGARVLVERKLPEEISREELRSWVPLLAPSEDLRRWFAAHPSQWNHFRDRYLDELNEPDVMEALQELELLTQKEDRVTLVTCAKNVERSHAAVLRDLIGGVKKPPASSGPARAASSARARARRPR